MVQQGAVKGVLLVTAVVVPQRQQQQLRKE
jgi:hypothetical protein